MSSGDFVTALRGAAEYVHAHRGKTFVVVFPGETCNGPHFDSLLADIALLSNLGVRLVLVHGARPQIDAELAVRGLTPTYCGDLRVSTPEVMRAVKAAVGALRIDIEASLAASPVQSSSLEVVGGTWVAARPVGVRDGVDHQLTGEVRKIDLDAIRDQLAAGRIALLSPLGYSPTGEAFNLRNADIAEAVAIALGADKLIFVLETDPSSWPIADSAGDVGQLLLSDAERFLLSNYLLSQLPVEDRNCVVAAVAAGRNGVRRVHLVSGARDGALLQELYTRDGSGLMFYAAEDYEATRTATIADIPGIQALIRPLEAAGVLIPRSREQLELQIDGYTVMVRDGTVIACNAVIDLGDNDSGESTAEVACVAVHPQYRGKGRAETLLLRAEKQARARGVRKLLALTTRTSHWFFEHGFDAGTPADLPAGRRARYNPERNSLVVMKEL